MKFKCEICGSDSIQEQEDRFICGQCGAIYAYGYYNTRFPGTDEPEAEAQEEHRYTQPSYEDPFQRRMILTYSVRGSGIEAYEKWKELHAGATRLDNNEITVRSALIDAAEKEKDCNPWMEMAPIARDEEQALEFGSMYAYQYMHGQIDADAVLKNLKNGKISVNSSLVRSDLKGCLLITAIRKPDRALVDYLFEHDCNIDVEGFKTAQDGQKIFETPLSAAIEAGDTEIIDELIRRGADIHQKIRIGSVEMNLLSMAARGCSSSIVSHLIKCGMDPNEETFYAFRCIPLYDALINQQYENAKVLIDAGADVNYIIRAQDADYTMLNWAIIHDDMEAFNLLLAAHADPNCIRVSHSGGGDNPALFDAVWKMRHEMVKRLVFAGADIHCCAERYGQKVKLLDQARANLDIEISRFLVDHGAT